MSRYIDADKFKNHIENCICEVQNTNGNSEDFKIVLRALAKQPTADVKEFVRGEWVRPKNESDPLWHLCSNCGKGQNQKFDVAKRHQTEWAGEIWFSPFCPNCGADMRGVRRK